MSLRLLPPPLPPLLLLLLAAGRAARADAGYRLNTTVEPISYAISISPRFDTGDESAFSFDGEVTVRFTSSHAVDRVTLHAEGLAFGADDVSLAAGAAGAAPVALRAQSPLQFDEKYSFVHVYLQAEILAGVEYDLKITYRGPIREDLNGFYRNYYVENGVKKWLGATQFEPTHARKAFPCFDEPDLKAVFTLTVDRPKHYQPTLTNTKMLTSMELSNGNVREIFHPTPRMSTYLVAFLVSEFEAAANITVASNEFGVYTRPGVKDQAEYAFDFGRRVVQALGDYYGIDYYSVESNLRLDHVALIDFRAGAMENWGLIKYREALLLFSPEHSNPYYKYRIAQIVAHETTHMWFGNLVTCHWWSDTWLNEGFANYFQDYITASVEPEVGSEEILVTGSVYSAYDADDFPDSHPISYEDVNSPSEISAHFGTVTYQKAGAVIRMMHHLIGDDAFKFGLNSYLQSNKFQAGYPNKLYEGLEKGVTRYDSLAAYPETNVTEVMSSWITQAGHPVLRVAVDRERYTVSLAQERFYINASHESAELYKIPVTFTWGDDPNFNNTKPAFIMHERSHVFSVERTSGSLSWVIFNIQETGLYRVNYDGQTWDLISAELKGNNRETIHHLNRAKIVNDLFAFLYSDEVSFERVRDVLSFLEDETDYSVWLAAVRGFTKLRNSYLGSDVLTLIDDFALELMENIIAKLGYTVRDTDDLVTQWNRMRIMEFACKIGHQGCNENMLALFKDFKENGKEIPPSLRSAAYCTGLRHGGADDYDFLWNRMATTNVANEARLIGDIMGCSSDEDKLRSYLVSMLVEDGPIKKQDLTVPLSSVLSDYANVNVVIDELDKNIALWTSIYSTLDSVLPTIASALHTEKEFNDYESWLSACTQCGEQAVTSARASLASARAAAAWADGHQAAVAEGLRGGARAARSSAAVLALSVSSAAIVRPSL